MRQIRRFIALLLLTAVVAAPLAAAFCPMEKQDGCCCGPSSGCTMSCAPEAGHFDAQPAAALSVPYELFLSEAVLTATPSGILPPAQARPTGTTLCRAGPEPYLLHHNLLL